MIKFVLVVYAMTATGPAVQPIAEFTRANKQYCEDVGVLVVKSIKRNRNDNIRAVTYRCVEVTKV